MDKRRRKWTKERRAKFAATIAAKKNGRPRKREPKDKMRPQTILVMEGKKLAEYQLKTVQAYVRKG